MHLAEKHNSSLKTDKTGENISIPETITRKQTDSMPFQVITHTEINQ